MYEPKRFGRGLEPAGLFVHNTTHSQRTLGKTSQWALPSVSAYFSVGVASSIELWGCYAHFTLLNVFLAASTTGHITAVAVPSTVVRFSVTCAQCKDSGHDIFFLDPDDFHLKKKAWVQSPKVSKNINCKRTCVLC